MVIIYMGVNNINSKKELIDDFRILANKKIEEIDNIPDYKEKSKIINKYIESIRNSKIDHLNKLSMISSDYLSNILLIYYCSYVVMLESRNKVWPYEYMAFARRIGDLWEPFCKLPFIYPVKNEVIVYDPMQFTMFQQEIYDDMVNTIDNLPITKPQKDELIEKYNNVWSLVDSGNINLGLDLHVKIGDEYYDIDYKSGFSSNEKGNTNRLLLVGSIFHSLKDNHHTLLFVRQKEEENNHYLTRLSNSNYWEVYCSDNTYKKIFELSGFDLKKWINENISWEKDITKEFKDHLISNNLLGYLSW